MTPQIIVGPANTNPTTPLELILTILILTITIALTHTP